MVLYISTNLTSENSPHHSKLIFKHASNALAWLDSNENLHCSDDLLAWATRFEWQKNTMIQICHWISKFTCKSDNYTHSDTSILFHCQCPQLRSVYLKGRSLRRQNWLNWMECFSGLPNLPHSQVLLFEIKILIQEAGLPPDWPNKEILPIPTGLWQVILTIN